MKTSTSDLNLLAEIAERQGTPTFVYFLDEVYRRIDTVRSAFGGRFKVSYAVKANPNHTLLRRLRGRVDTLDISSGGELLRGKDAGWSPAAMSFTGPAKQTFELETSVREGVGELVVESLHEAASIQRLAEHHGRKQTVMVRIAPRKIPRGFGINMAGKPSQFGIDEEDADDAIREILRMPNLDLIGFHIYSGTQCLEPTAIAENYGIFIEIFRQTASTHGLSPRKLIFGSGIGIPYTEGDESVNVQEVADLAKPKLDELLGDKLFSNAELFLETGRYLIGEAGIFLTRVVGRKSSRGTEIGICDGGMNNHLGACGHLGSVIHRNYPIFKVTPASGEIEPFDLVGPLCTSIDTLGHGVDLPGLEIDDVLGIRSSGAYGVTASPIYFISHRPPREVLVTGSDTDATTEDISQFQPATGL